MTDEPPVSVVRDQEVAGARRAMCFESRVCVSRYLDTSPVSSALLFSLLRARSIADKSCRWLQQHLKHKPSLSLGFAFDDVKASVGDQGRGNDSDEGGANLGLVG